MNTNFRALISAEVALEEVPDALENIVAGLLHLEGEGVAVEPGNNEEKGLVEAKEERKVGRNNYQALLVWSFTKGP